MGDIRAYHGSFGIELPVTPQMSCEHKALGRNNISGENFNRYLYSVKVKVIHDQGPFSGLSKMSVAHDSRIPKSVQCCTTWLENRLEKYSVQKWKMGTVAK